MDQLFARYTIGAASPETLAKVSYVAELKEERLATSQEAHDFIGALRNAKLVRDAVADGCRKDRIQSGWVPQLASISQLELLALHLAPVVGFMEMFRSYTGEDTSVCEHLVCTRGSRLHVTITLPAHEDIRSQGIGFDRDLGTWIPIKGFAPERTTSWALTLASKSSFAQCLNACCRAISELRHLDEGQLELSLSALGAFDDWRGKDPPLSFQEKTIQLGILLGLSRVPFLGRIVVEGKKGNCFELPAVDLFQTEQLKAAISHLNDMQSNEIRNITRSLMLTERPNYSFPLAIPWRVIFSRAQEAENSPEQDGEIRDKLLRRAVGLAYIETLPHYLITQNSRVDSAIESVNSWLVSFSDLPDQDPRVRRYKTVRSILLEDRGYFEKKIPSLKY